MTVEHFGMRKRRHRRDGYIGLLVVLILIAIIILIVLGLMMSRNGSTSAAPSA